MSVRVHIPSFLRRLFHSEAIVTIDAENVSEAISALEDKIPGIADRLCEPDGSLRRYVNIFISVQDLRLQAELNSVIEEDGELWIVPNVAGGGI